MRKRDYSEHHSHGAVTHEIVLRKPKKRRPFFLKPFFLILIILIVLLGTAAFSPVLAIKKITIAGTNDSEIIRQVEEGTKTFLARQKIANFLILAQNNLKKELSNPEKIESIKISHKFPSTLIIEVQPKIPAFVWQEGERYFLIDNDGKVTTPIALSQNEWNLPFVSAATTTVFNLQDQLVQKETVNFIKKFNKEYNKATINQTLSRYIIPDLVGQEIQAVTKNGWKIILLSTNSVNKAVADLKYLLSTKFKDQKPKEYLDLRLEDKIFYK